VIRAAQMLGAGVVNTFVGRDWTKSVDDNWPRFQAIWSDILHFADENGIKIAIENCPMLFTADEWPGGKNLAHSPAIWRRMFEEIPSPNFGLNYDPSHLVWQHIDCVKPLWEFGRRIFHLYVERGGVAHEPPGGSLEAEPLALAAREQLERAVTEIEREKEKALVEMRAEVVQAVVTAAQRVIHEHLDDAGHRRLIERFLDEVGAAK
jgi:hypothetical protein